MRIGTEVITKCNECPAYDWAGERIRNGNHEMRCDFGAFHSFYGDVHPIPDDCPIKAADVTEAFEKQPRTCSICGWEGFVSDLKTADNGTENIICPDCGCSIKGNE